MKKLFSLLFTLLFVISFSSPTGASSNTHVHNHNHEHVHTEQAHHKVFQSNHDHEHELFDLEKDVLSVKGATDTNHGGGIGALYIPCEGTGGKHKMIARGIGTHILTNGSKWTGNLYQCSGCRMTLTSTYNYFNSDTRYKGPGKYILASAPVAIGNGGYRFSGEYSLSGPASSWITGVFGSMSFFTG
ncbi:hypothetical protein ACQCVB_19415 [Fictibacillus phosphorivorans]|uniref:hypothetical protein n=1 Tax=Fictibacillus phosphorivorans TaxID=1221500 RepID=UPI003CEADA0F